jgi:hypothetical protein
MKKLSLLIPIVVILSCIGASAAVVGGFALVSMHMKSYPFYQQAMTMAQNDPAVIELLGTPVKDSIFVMGNERNFTYGGGYANLDTFIRGPKGKATLSIYATYDADQPWVVEDMTIRQDKKIILTYRKSAGDKGFQQQQ